MVVTGSIPNTPSARGSACTALALRKREAGRKYRYPELLSAGAIGAIVGALSWWTTLDDPICFNGAIRRVGDGYEKVLVGPRVYIDALLDRVGVAVGAVDLQLAQRLRAGQITLALDRAIELGPQVLLVVDGGCSEIIARIMVGCA